MKISQSTRRIEDLLLEEIWPKCGQNCMYLLVDKVSVVVHLLSPRQISSFISVRDSHWDIRWMYEARDRYCKRSLRLNRWIVYGGHSGMYKKKKKGKIKEDMAWVGRASMVHWHLCWFCNSEMETLGDDVDSRVVHLVGANVGGWNKPSYVLTRQ